MAWTPADIPDLTGRRAVVTGGNAGLGLQIANPEADLSCGRSAVDPPVAVPLASRHCGGLTWSKRPGLIAE